MGAIVNVYGGRAARRCGCAALAAALAVTLSAGACARPHSRPPDFAVTEWTGPGVSGRRLASDHFEVYSTVGDPELEAALPAFLEAAYSRFTSDLPPVTRPGRRLAIHVFGTREEWKAFTEKRFPARYPVYARIRCGGYTEANLSACFYVSRAATLATLVHEAWHQYVATHFEAELPAWLNEGLACYYEGFEFAGDGVRFTPGRNTFRIRHLRQAVQGDTLIPLERLIDTDASAVIAAGSERLTRTYYAQVWALVTFLRHGADHAHAEAFDRLLADVTAGRFQARLTAAALTAPGEAVASSAERALSAYFGATPPALAAAYEGYVRGLAGFHQAGPDRRSFRPAEAGRVHGNR